MTKRRAEDEDVPALAVSPSLGHYSTGFSVRLDDKGNMLEPVSSLGPIGFVTRPLTAAAWKRYRAKQKKRR